MVIYIKKRLWKGMVRCDLGIKAYAYQTNMINSDTGLNFTDHNG